MSKIKLEVPNYTPRQLEFVRSEIGAFNAVIIKDTGDTIIIKTKNPKSLYYLGKCMPTDK